MPGDDLSEEIIEPQPPVEPELQTELSTSTTAEPPFPEEAEEIEEEPSGPSPDAERVSKLIARAGIASRRAAEEMIVQGRVSVNGHFVTEPGIKADLSVDKVTVDGRPLRATERETVVILFHKPRNVMTTRDDPGGRHTVFDALPHKYAKLHPVGRLDFDTSGVLLLTDDGALTHLLTHPSHGVEKVYEARVRGEVKEAALNVLRKGVMLDDGKTAPAKVKVVAQREKNALIEITIKEGRNRQVRRMLEAVGHPVSSLRRVSFGGVQLEGLPAGEHRVLLKGEVHELRKKAEGKQKRGAGFAKPSAPKAGTRPTPKSKPKPRPEKDETKSGPRGAKPAATSKSQAPKNTGGAKPAARQSPTARRIASKWK